MPLIISQFIYYGQDGLCNLCEILCAVTASIIYFYMYGILGAICVYIFYIGNIAYILKIISFIE